MTGNEIVNRALVELARPGSLPLENGNTLSKELQDILNRTIDDLVTTWPFDFFVQDTPDEVATRVGISVYDIPSGCIDIVDIVLDTGATDTHKLKKLPLRRFRAKWAAVNYLANGKPCDWTQITRKTFQVAPKADAVYTMLVTSTKRPTPITDYEQEVESVPGEFHKHLVYGVAFMGATAVQDSSRLKEQAALWGAAVKKMIEDDRRDSDLEYEMQPFRASGGTYADNYWANPFVRHVE